MHHALVLVLLLGATLVTAPFPGVGEVIIARVHATHATCGNGALATPELAFFTLAANASLCAQQPAPLSTTNGFFVAYDNGAGGILLDSFTGNTCATSLLASGPLAAVVGTCTNLDANYDLVWTAYTPTASSSASGSGTATGSASSSPTATSSSSGSSSAAKTPSASGTASLSASATCSGSSSGTATPAASATSTGSPSGTATTIASATSSGTSTSGASSTPTGSASVSGGGTGSGTATAKRTQTAAVTSSGAPSASDSATACASATSSGSAGGTASATSTRSPSGSATGTGSSPITSSPSATNTQTGSSRATASPAPTGSGTATATATASPSGSARGSASATPTGTQSLTLSAMPSATSSASGTSTASGTATQSRSSAATRPPTATATGTGSPSLSSSPSATSTQTGSASATTSPAATVSAASTASGTGTVSASATASATGSGTSSATGSATRTASPTASPSATSSASRCASVTASPSTSPSASRCASATASVSASTRASPSGSATRSLITPRATVSASAARSTSPSPTGSATVSPWCPKGAFQPAGALECTACAGNTWKDFNGTGACKPCAQWPAFLADTANDYVAVPDPSGALALCAPCPGAFQVYSAAEEVRNGRPGCECCPNGQFADVLTPRSALPAQLKTGLASVNGVGAMCKACVKQDLCLKCNACRTGYKGLNCLECGLGFYNNLGNCLPCPPSALIVIGFILVGILVLAVLFTSLYVKQHSISKERESFFKWARLFVAPKALRLFATRLFFMYRLGVVPYPSPFLNVAGGVSFLAGDISAAGPECFTKDAWPFDRKFWVVFGVLMSFVGLAVFMDVLLPNMVLCSNRLAKERSSHKLRRLCGNCPAIVPRAVVPSSWEHLQLALETTVPLFLSLALSAVNRVPADNGQGAYVLSDPSFRFEAFGAVSSASYVITLFVLLFALFEASRAATAVANVRRVKEEFLKNPKLDVDRVRRHSHLANWNTSNLWFTLIASFSVLLQGSNFPMWACILFLLLLTFLQAVAAACCFDTVATTLECEHMLLIQRARSDKTAEGKPKKNTLPGLELEWSFMKSAESTGYLPSRTRLQRWCPRLPCGAGLCVCCDTYNPRWQVALTLASILVLESSGIYFAVACENAFARGFNQTTALPNSTALGFTKDRAACAPITKAADGPGDAWGIFMSLLCVATMVLLLCPFFRTVIVRQFFVIIRPGNSAAKANETDKDFASSSPRADFVAAGAGEGNGGEAAVGGAALSARLGPASALPAVAEDDDGDDDDDYDETEKFIEPTRGNVFSVNIFEGIKSARYLLSAGGITDARTTSLRFSMTNPLQAPQGGSPTARAALALPVTDAFLGTPAAAAARRRASLRLLEPLQPRVVSATQQMRGEEAQRRQVAAEGVEGRRVAFMAERAATTRQHFEARSGNRAIPPPPPPPPPPPLPGGRPRRSSSEESLQHLEEALSVWGATESFWALEDMGDSGSPLYKNLDTGEFRESLPPGGHLTFSPVSARNL